VPESELPGSDGWRVVQLADVLHRIELANDRALTLLYRFDGELEEDARETLPHDRLLAIKADVREVVELSSSAERLIEALADDEIEIDYAHVAEAAARDLAAGTILDLERVLLVAGLLGVEQGLTAFAACVRESDVHTAWEGATLTDLLGAIRGVTPQLVRRIATAAGIAPGAELALCAPDEVARLAARIEDYLRERP
jgi:hypothetical protein